MIPSLRETASAQALQHRFCHHPQCAIELNVGINAVNGPGMDTFSFCTATGNPAFWQQRIRETVRHALNVHPRLTALRVDLRFPDVPAATDAAVISRFINALKARIDAYQKRKHREGKRVHPTTLHYVWAREFGECKGKKHYHLMLLVNRDTWCRAGDYRAPGSLAGMIKQAWCSALGVDVGCHATLVHFPAWPAVWLERDDDTGFQQVLERADYLAKEHTKAHCTGERNFGCSRS
ncbi:hypothetical protein G822_01228 [Escherichia coli HVH 164 (4-5953081)]|nr:hypothetical protein G822_01228 [Escherichia coli HVH 164 (4-5953081)]